MKFTKNLQDFSKRIKLGGTEVCLKFKKREYKMNNLNKIVNLGSFRKLKKTSALSISLLIIISSLSIFGAASIQVTAAADTFTFGNTSIGTMTNSFTTDRDASRFQLTQNGQLQTITVYYTNTGFNAKTAIYADNNGAPSTLIAQSNSQTITQSGWQTFTLPQTTLTPGYYWLCTVSNNPSYGKMAATSTNQHAWKYSPYSAEYPATFGTPRWIPTNRHKHIRHLHHHSSSQPHPNTHPTSTPAPTALLHLRQAAEQPQITVSAVVASSYSGTHTPKPSNRRSRINRQLLGNNVQQTVFPNGYNLTWAHKKASAKSLPTSTMGTREHTPITSKFQLTAPIGTPLYPQKLEIA